MLFLNMKIIPQQQYKYIYIYEYFISFWRFKSSIRITKNLILYNIYTFNFSTPKNKFFSNLVFLVKNVLSFKSN